MSSQQVACDKVDQMVEQYKHVWKTRAAVFSFIKGTLRRGWNHHPAKLELLKKVRKQIPNPNPKGKKPTVWGADCPLCGRTLPLKDFQVDHILEETASLTKVEDIQSCAEKLLLVVEEDLRVICCDCHEVVTLSQRMGCSFEQAKFEKDFIIPFGKLKAKQQIETLKEYGIDCAKTNGEQRVALYRALMEEQCKQSS